jgi:hypothetical protein
MEIVFHQKSFSFLLLNLKLFIKLKNYCPSYETKKDLLSVIDNISEKILLHFASQSKKSSISNMNDIKMSVVGQNNSGGAYFFNIVVKK